MHVTLIRKITKGQLYDGSVSHYELYKVEHEKFYALSKVHNSITFSEYSTQLMYTYQIYVYTYT